MEQDNIPTPYFLLEKNNLINEVNSLKAAIHNNWKNTIIAYSVKTNSLPYLAKLLLDLGLYAEVVSEDEYQMIRLCGFPPNKIVCNGPIKSDMFVSQLLQEKTIINIDSHSEIEHIDQYARSNHKHCSIGIRVNLNIENYFPGESKAGTQGSRFGFCMDNEELSNAINILREIPNVTITGLHLHVSTNTRRIEIFKWLVHMFAQIIRQYHLTDVRYLDIGGGFWGGLKDKPGWSHYLQAISKTLKQENFSENDITLIIEPGVSLLAGSFCYYMKVTDVKDTNHNRFVVMDGSRIHIDPLFHKTNYYYQCLTSSERPILSTQKLVGFTCLESDIIMDICNCKELHRGDIIICKKVGAYTMTLSPLFISYFPSVYIKEEDGTLRCIRKKWTAKEFIQSSEIS